MWTLNFLIPMGFTALLLLIVNVVGIILDIPDDKATAQSTYKKWLTPKRIPYPTDITDVEWQRVQELIPVNSLRKYNDMREIVNAILYKQQAGCKWELLPHDLPPSNIVCSYYNKWLADGDWEQIRSGLSGKSAFHEAVIGF